MIQHLIIENIINKYIRIACCILFSFVSLTNISAQKQLRFVHYNVKDGLSQNSVQCIYRDKDGIVWIGTQDGLNRFDGKTFTIFRHKDADSNSISDQFVTNIHEADDGHLWVGTRNGLNRLNKKNGSFRRYFINANEKHEFQAEYSSFFPQQDNNVLLIKEGLYLLNAITGKFTKISGPFSKNCKWFLSNSYKAWVVDDANQFYFYPDVRKKIFITLGISPFNKKEDFNELEAIVYHDSLLFIYNRNKANEIFVYDVKQKKILKKIQLPLKFTHLNVQDPKNIFASTALGLYKTGIDTKPFLISNSNEIENSLPPGNVLSSYSDAENNLWVSTSANGLAVNSHSFRNFKYIKLPVKNDIVTCIVKSERDLFVGTFNGVYKIKNFSGHSGVNKFIRILSDKNITSITADRKNRLWVALKEGSIKIIDSNGKFIKRIILPEGEGAGRILHLMTNSKGEIVISTTFSGVYILSTDGNIIHHLFKDAKQNFKKLTGHYVLGTYEDKYNNLWVSNNRGLDIYRNKMSEKETFPSYDDRKSFIKRTIVTSTTEDNDGAYWITTIRNGVYRYANGNAEHFTVSSGLSSDVVYNSICDNRGRIWVTTSAGLNIFDRNKNTFTSFSLLTGVQNSSYKMNAIAKYGDDLLFGTSDGLLVCKTTDIEMPETNFSASVTAIKINGQPVEPQKKHLEIMPDEKIITFELVTSPSFYTGNIIYQYRLPGVNNEWETLPSGIQTVTYTGLPYGELKMEVRAADALNNLEDAPIDTFTIISKPPFWKTTFFTLSLFFLFILMVIGLVTWYNKQKSRRLIAKLRMANQLREERTRIGRDLHDNIGAYASALIAGLNHIKTTNKIDREKISDLKDYGSSIMEFLRETIWMLNSDTLTITSFADRFKNYIKRIGKSYPAINFIFKENLQNNIALSPKVMLNIFRIMQEALQNACKHSSASEITITVMNQSDLNLEVKDNGKGFIVNQQLEGYGLKNMKERAKEAGFELHIETNTTGTKVTLQQNTANAG